MNAIEGLEFWQVFLGFIGALFLMFSAGVGITALLFGRG